MATISNLDVNLVANTKRFDRRIKKSGGVFGGFARRIGSFSAAKFAGGIGLIAGSVGTIMSLGAAMGRVNDQFDKIDRISKFSDEVGATVAQMQALQLQAELTGTDQSTLEKGIQRLTRRIGEAKLGMGEGVKALDSLGLKANDLADLPLTDQLGVIADKINQQETAADKAAAAYGLFGRQGQELMTFFAGGAAGIQAATDDIESFNGALTRVDGAQIEMANDAWTRMQSLINVIWQNIAVQAAPIMTALVEMFTEGAKEAGGFSSIIETGFMILTEGIKFALNAWDFFLAGVAAWRGVFASGMKFVLEGLAQVEAALVKIGGKDFDFGIRGLADAAAQVAEEYNIEAQRRFSRFEQGTAGNEFQDRLDEIKARAEDIAEASATPPPPPPGPDLAAMLESGRQFAGAALGALGDGLASIELPELKAERQTGPAAAAIGSSAAQSIINSIGRDDRELELQKARNAKLDGMNRFLQSSTRYLQKIASNSDDTTTVEI